MMPYNFQFSPSFQYHDVSVPLLAATVAFNPKREYLFRKRMSPSSSSSNISPFDRCFALPELLLQLSSYILTLQDLCSLACTSRPYHDAVMPIVTRNVRLKDLTRIHSLALHIKRTPNIFVTCRSLEIGTFTGKWLKGAKLLEEMCNPQFTELTYEYLKREFGTSQHFQGFVQDRAFKDILHEDLLTVLEFFAVCNEPSLPSKLTDNGSSQLRKFSWASRKDEPMVQSTGIAEALSKLSANLDSLHLTIQSWEISFWVRNLPCFVGILER